MHKELLFLAAESSQIWYRSHCYYITITVRDTLYFLQYSLNNDNTGINYLILQHIPHWCGELKIKEQFLALYKIACSYLENAWTTLPIQTSSSIAHDKKSGNISYRYPFTYALLLSAKCANVGFDTLLSMPMSVAHVIIACALDELYGDKHAQRGDEINGFK